LQRKQPCSHLKNTVAETNLDPLQKKRMHPKKCVHPTMSDENTECRAVPQMEETCDPNQQVVFIQSALRKPWANQHAGET